MGARDDNGDAMYISTLRSIVNRNFMYHCNMTLKFEKISGVSTYFFMFLVAFTITILV